MAVVVVGIHEADAPLERFEKVSVPEADLAKVLSQLTDSPHLAEAVVLSTCMRTEIYAVVERFHDGLGDIESFLTGRLGEPAFVGNPSPTERPLPGGGTVELGGGFSCAYDDAAVAHLFEVAAGLDSPVLGEGEVLRQVRDAADAARREQALGPVLGPLFRHAVEAGKRVRSETAIAKGRTSLATAVAELASDHALGLGGRRVLLIGAGEMIAGVARALAGRSDLTGEVVVANRSLERARSVADIVAGRAVRLDALESELEAADVVITSTAASEPILRSDVLAETASRRNGRRIVVVDAAVPRDVEPAVAELEGIELLDVEAVRRFAEEQMSGRVAEVPAARAILAEEMERWRTTSAGRLAAPVVSALRERAEVLRQGELERYGSHLAALGPDERELVETITRRIVAKLLHEPTVHVKEAAGSPRGERLAEALRALFDL